MRCAQQRQVADAEPAAAQVMVIDIPMSQNLLMGEECQKACDDNFLKCTRGVRPLSLSAAAVCSQPARLLQWVPRDSPSRAPGASCPPPAPFISQAGKQDYPGTYVYYPFEPTKSDPERLVLTCGRACVRISPRRPRSQSRACAPRHDAIISPVARAGAVAS